MKFTTAFVSTLLTTGALAGVVRREPRAHKRGQAIRKTVPFQPATNVTAEIDGPINVHPSYSTNWAGAALEGSGYTGVFGTFVIPKISAPAGANSQTEYSASAWVGIDGYTCESAILQTGVDFNIQNGKVSFDAWYEWYPDYAYTFTGISFSQGDTVTLSITATSTTTGSVTIKNVTTGKTVSHTFTRQSQALCETNAEWIVEDFTEVQGGQESLVPLVNFGTVTFTNAYASTSSGNVGPNGAEIVDLINASGSKVLTSASAGSNTVTVKYLS